MWDYISWLLLWNIGQSQGESMKLTKDPYLAMRKLALKIYMYFWNLLLKKLSKICVVSAHVSVEPYKEEK